MKKLFVAAAITMAIPTPATASVASGEYVRAQTETKVDAAPDSRNTMAGEYNVTGHLTVPTPALPE